MTDSRDVTATVTRLRRDVGASQFLLYAPLLVCALLKPEVTIHEGGISNYGNYLETAPLYILAFAANVGFLFATARLLTSTSLRPLGRVLDSLCLVEFLVLASTFPRHFSFTFSYIHDYLGVVQFIIEFVFAVVVVARRPVPLAWIGLGIEVAGSLGGLLSALKVDHLLFWGQVVGSAGFSVVVCFGFVGLAAGALRATP